MEKKNINVEEIMETVTEKAEEVAETVKATAKKTSTRAKKTVDDTVAKTRKTAKETTAAAKKAAKETTETAKKVAKETGDAAKKTAAKLVLKETFFQYAGKEYKESEILEKVEAAYKESGHRLSSVKSLMMYIKPEDGAAYYVINDKYSGKVDL